MTIFSTKCWNCGSSNYKETLSKEHCSDCGITCDYHGAGCNDAYRKAHEEKAQVVEERYLEWLEKEYGE